MDEKYIVLARKYRPMTFDDLVGQDALVKTVTNAIKAHRIPHAYLLTGIRGIGKTTSARIIAKTLNCIGKDGVSESEIPLKPCGECTHCRSIIEGRDIDVTEIDAASNTGVEKIREVIEAVKYTPVSARYKIYIIDEVHMLSSGAFNALLKTLEEPPEHAKFILATTELRKIPVTIQSRCQRFDLKRLSFDSMSGYLGKIADKEGVSVSLEALNVLALISEGSVRDGLSLLDQAIAAFGKNITENDVRQMIGFADKSDIVSLFYDLMSGDAAKALDIIHGQSEFGVEPAAVIKDLLEITHLITRLKIGAGINEILYTPEFIAKIKEYSGHLNMASLTLMWQMLMKGMTEVVYSPFPAKSLEMLLVRICYATEIPDFRELLKKNFKLASNEISSETLRPVASISDVAIFPPPLPPRKGISLSDEKKDSPFDKKKVTVSSGFDIYKLAEKYESNPMLACEIFSALCLVKIDNHHLVIADNDDKAKKFSVLLPKKLKEWTGDDWTAELVKDEKHAAKSIKENHDHTHNYFNEKVMDDPAIKQIFTRFNCQGISKVEIVSDSDNEQKDEELYNFKQEISGFDGFGSEAFD